MKIRIVSIYRATKPQDGGPRRAYCQQQQALLKLGIRESPDEQFWKDLWNEVEKWTDNRDQLVLCGDWNQDIRTESFLEQFKQYNLIPAITTK